MSQRSKVPFSIESYANLNLDGIKVFESLPKFGTGLIGHLSALLLSWPFIITGIIREKPDIIHVQNPTDIIPMVTALTNLLLQKPLVYQINDPGPESIRSHMGLNPFLKKPYLLFAKLSEKIVLSISNAVILLNESSTLKFIRTRKIDPRKTIIYYYHTVIRNNKDASPDKSIPKDFILYVGSLTTPFLGLEELILSFFPIWNIHKTRLIIIGDGPLKEVLKKKIRKINGEAYIKLFGYVSHDIVQFYIKNAKCCIIPYLKTELTDIATPTKMFEYMSEGKAIVYPDLSGFREIFGMENAGMYRSTIPADAVRVIDILLKNVTLRKTTETQNKRLFEKYDYDKEIQKIIRLYEKIIDSA